jgi:DtxR family Mn-dependent transcriptional regulator
VLETFLHRALGISLERVHPEAERIEHVISDDLAMRIAALLGRPECDPHGHPIPYGDGDARRKPLPTLATLPIGGSARVVSLDDRDENAVATLAAAGVLPGSRLRVERCERARIFVRRGNRVVGLLRSHAAMVRIAT